MSLLALTLEDFQTTLRFSNKIEDSQVRPFINDAYALDLVPLLGAQTIEALNGTAAFSAPEYAASAPPAVGGLVSYAERVYAAGSPVPTATPPLPGKTVAGWGYQPLPTLWQHLLKPWWLRQAYARFVAQHGLDVTKAGITMALDRSQGTYERPSAAQSAALLASVETTAESYRARLVRFLQTESEAYRADNTTGYDYYPNTCAAPTRRPKRRLRGV